MLHDSYTYHGCAMYKCCGEFGLAWLSVVYHRLPRECHRKTFEIIMMIVAWTQNTLKTYEII